MRYCLPQCDQNSAAVANWSLLSNMRVHMLCFVLTGSSSLSRFWSLRRTFDLSPPATPLRPTSFGGLPPVSRFASCTPALIFCTLSSDSAHCSGFPSSMILPDAIRALTVSAILAFFSSGSTSSVVRAMFSPDAGLKNRAIVACFPPDGGVPKRFFGCSGDEASASDANVSEDAVLITPMLSPVADDAIVSVDAFLRKRRLGDFQIFWLPADSVGSTLGTSIGSSSSKSSSSSPPSSWAWSPPPLNSLFFFSFATFLAWSKATYLQVILAFAIGSHIIIYIYACDSYLII